jgi:ATPase subunit of ABC transporter with duplicated ATPase domains
LGVVGYGLTPVGAIQVSHVSWHLPGGRLLLDDVGFQVNDGDHTSLIGANGAGKTSLLRLITGDATGYEGTISITGRLGVMRQLVGSIRDETTVRDFFLSLSEPRVIAAADALAKGEVNMMEDPMAYAEALGTWGEAGGYEAEVYWDATAQRSLGQGMDQIGSRRLATFSGGEQKRLALEFLLRGDHDVLILDEPDNFLDIPGKRWLEAEIQASTKTILFVSHDRELLAAAATKMVTVETFGAWTHHAGFVTYHEARKALLDKMEKDRAQYEDERLKLVEYVKLMRIRSKQSMSFAPKLAAAESKLRQFDLKTPEPPEEVREQRVKMQLRGARTGKKAVMIEKLELNGLTDPFDTEFWFGDRVAVLGANGAGKSHFLRLIAGDPSVSYEGSYRLGAGVVAGHFNQTHDQPELKGRILLDILATRGEMRAAAVGRLRRYGLGNQQEQEFETLSGGQQARFQILLLELGGVTLLLLDEPTDNLDLVSAEALEDALTEFEGTIVTVTHDRWFLRNFDRFIVFNDDCSVSDLLEAPEMYR